MHLPFLNIKSFNVDLKFKIKNLKFTKAFTLIELLVVISIIAILLAVATVSYTNAQQKGRDNKRKSDLKAVQQALEIYFNQNGKYPNADLSNGRIICNVTGDGNTRNWGTEFYCDPTGTPDPPKVTYMNPLPRDPITSSYPTYWYWSDGTITPQTYKLYAKIENGKDKDLVNTSQTLCPGTPPNSTYQTDIGSGTMNYYCVTNP